MKFVLLLYGAWALHNIVRLLLLDCNHREEKIWYIEHVDRRYGEMSAISFWKNNGPS